MKAKKLCRKVASFLPWTLPRPWWVVKRAADGQLFLMMHALWWEKWQWYCHRDRTFFRIIKKKVRARFSIQHITSPQESLMGRLFACVDWLQWIFWWGSENFFLDCVSSLLLMSEKIPRWQPGKEKSSIRHSSLWLNRVPRSFPTWWVCLWWVVDVPCLAQIRSISSGFSIMSAAKFFPGLSWQIGESLFCLLKFAVNRRRGNFGQIWLAAGSW